MEGCVWRDVYERGGAWVGGGGVCMRGVEHG